MTKHIHAKLMALYAQDALETDKPWERWQIKHHVFSQEWTDINSPLLWNPDFHYRRKTKTICINGYEVPEPLQSTPNEGTTYFVPILYSLEFYKCLDWANDDVDKAILDRKLCHSTPEGAIAHAKALLSFTKQDHQP